MNKVSDCCGARLRNYDHNWDDGICTECNEHSPAFKEKRRANEESEIVV